VNRKLTAILGAGFVLRIAYVLLQPRFDPLFARPILDGATYVALARAFASGGAPAGVFYMPPLYPWALSAFLRTFGEVWTLLFMAQQAALVASAGVLALVARRVAGDAAALATAALVLLYHPLLFFASRPLGETASLLLLAAGLAAVSRESERSGLAAGLSVGIASLARPNLLPLAPVWAAWELSRKHAGRAALLLAAAVVAIVPAAWHNHAALPGHVVPVSANGGVVFWLGNAPGAVGVYTPVAGFTGSLQTQQAESIAEASARAGRPLDAVESDAFWWREGLRARAADPVGTMGLVARRLALTLDNAEHGLDYPPALDANPLRFAAPLPFAVLLGLAIFGLSAWGFARTGGVPLWSAVVVAIAAPIVFYVSSRHRLPLAFLLTVPAGAGVAAIGSTRRILPYALAAGAIGLSFGLPTGDYVRTERAGYLAILSEVQLKSGELAAGAETAKRATELDPGNAIAWFNRGVIEAARGDQGAAERAYRAALAADPVQPDAAGNLAGILIATGRAGEAAPFLEKALAAWPRHTVGWTNLVVAYAAAGDGAHARDAVRRALGLGVALDPDLVKTVEASEQR